MGFPAGAHLPATFLPPPPFESCFGTQVTGPGGQPLSEALTLVLGGSIGAGTFAFY